MTTPPDPFAPPPQPPVPTRPPERAPGAGLGTAALVLGVLALVTGLTIVGGVLFGVPAVLLGLRARAAAHGGAAGTGIAGAVLGVLGLLTAAGVYLYIQDDLAEYEGCRKESVSLAQDQVCEDALRRSISGR